MTRKTLLEIIAENTAEIDGGYGTRCWMWTRPLNPDGYGSVVWGNVKWLVHRLMVALRDGDAVPEYNAAGEKMVVDHLCHNRWCCNPDHLEAVSNKVNTLRGWSPTAVAHTTGICQRGHALTEGNLYYRKDRPGAGYCKQCVLERGKARKTAAAAA